MENINNTTTNNIEDDCSKAYDNISSDSKDCPPDMIDAIDEAEFLGIQGGFMYSPTLFE